MKDQQFQAFADERLVGAILAGHRADRALRPDLADVGHPSYVLTVPPARLVHTRPVDEITVHEAEPVVVVSDLVDSPDAGISRPARHL